MAAVFHFNKNNVLHIYDKLHEFNHDPLMIAHQIGVRLLILDEQQTNYNEPKINQP